MDRGADKTSPGDDYWPRSQLWIPCARQFNVLYLLCLFRLLRYSALFQGAEKIHKYTNSGNQFNPPPPLSQGLRFKVCFEWPSPRPAYQVDQVDTKWCNGRQEIVWFQSDGISWQTKYNCLSTTCDGRRVTTWLELAGQFCAWWHCCHDIVLPQVVIPCHDIVPLVWNCHAAPYFA